MTRYGELGQPWVFVVRLEKRKSQDTRKEHKSIPAFKIARPRAHTPPAVPITGSSRLA
jgi:hypothetical protein